MCGADAAAADCRKYLAPWNEVTTTTRALPRTKASAVRFTRIWLARWFTWNVRSIPSSEHWNCCDIWPAFSTSPWIAPVVCTSRSANSVTEAMEAWSSCRNRTWPPVCEMGPNALRLIVSTARAPRFRSRDVSTTLPPAAASALAVSNPTPELPPVTTKVLPATLWACRVAHSCAVARGNTALLVTASAATIPTATFTAVHAPQLGEPGASVVELAVVTAVAALVPTVSSSSLSSSPLKSGSGPALLRRLRLFWLDAAARVTLRVVVDLSGAIGEAGIGGPRWDPFLVQEKTTRVTSCETMSRLVSATAGSPQLFVMVTSKDLFIFHSD